MSRLESGQRMPTAKVMEQLAARLGVSSDSFAGLGNSNGRATSGVVLAGAARVVDHMLAGRTAAALGLLDDIRVNLRDPDARWLAEYAAAACASRLGRTNEVFERLSSLDTMYRGLPVAARVLTSTMHAGAARELGRVRDAVELGERAVMEADGMATASDFPVGQALLLRVRARTTLAAALAEAGRTAEVFATCEQAIALAEAYPETEDHDSTPDPLADELAVVSHWMYAIALARSGNLESAGRHLGEAHQRSADAIGVELWCRVRVAAVSLFLETGATTVEAPEVLLNQVSDVRHAGRGQLDAQVFMLRAELALRKDDARGALDSAQAALDSGVLGSADRIRTLMTVVKVSTDLGLEDRRLNALEELLQRVETADADEVRPALLKEVAALSVRTLRNHGRV
ncbi:tetratricopeptide (TPR) repeat protein [Crossiella equi]|uniref:Tetratricopeptide (TPR) repeat protein n=1 Tax=Crossiella equi TaxID=130796 RepID=A0ABS5ALC1_9PSEU|nr:tetratricopeptide (TPR) repeat protein [Crossiella equi]